MASPKSIKDASVVAPAEPVDVVEADIADPGEVSEAQAAAAERAAEEWSSKTVEGGAPAKTGKPDPTKTSWIEVELVDEDDKGIPGIPYIVIAGDGSQYTGTTDEEGVGRISGIDPGNYDITFPRLDKDAWEPA